MSQNGKLDFGKLPSLESQQPEIIPQKPSVRNGFVIFGATF